jgi:ParB family chromosome partitioning protein
MGKSRSHIANLMRLLGLPDDVLEMLRDGRLTAGHARALITTRDPSALARQAVARGLSVRDVEKLAKASEDGGIRERSRRSERRTQTRVHWRLIFPPRWACRSQSIMTKRLVAEKY